MYINLLFLNLCFSPHKYFLQKIKEWNQAKFFNDWIKPPLVQLNKYETAPHFIQLTQNLTSDCWLI